MTNLINSKTLLRLKLLWPSVLTAKKSPFKIISWEINQEWQKKKNTHTTYFHHRKTGQYFKSQAELDCFETFSLSQESCSAQLVEVRKISRMPFFHYCQL